MSVYISRVQINNFRNFHELDVHLSRKAVIVGENKSGKTNLIYALRLILDPNLPDSARQLKEEDFWDGLESPMENGAEISISVDLRGFGENKALLAILSDCLTKDEEAPTARITYRYAPTPSLGEKGGDQQENKYDFVVYGGDDPTDAFGYQQRKWMPLQMLPALRDAETDLESWQRSPLRPLIDRLEVVKEDLEAAATKVDEATDEVLRLADVRRLSSDIEKRLENMVGEFHSVSPSLGIASTDALRLLRSLRLFVDGKRQRPIRDTSLGICNVLYLALLVLELERKEAAGERASTILAIEEPEAHLHPHLQRLVYRDFLGRESCVLLTTHSPQIVSVSPIRSLVLLKDHGSEKGSKATSTAKVHFTDEQVQDLERYLDATRGEILFARGVILVEGDAELYIIRAFADALGVPLDQRGISVCSVHGTDFVPYARLLGKEALNVPFVVVTDGDPYHNREGETLYRGYRRGIKLVESEEPDVASGLNELFKNRKWSELNESLCKLAIYVGKHSLEIDLALSQNNEEMVTALKELGSRETQQSRFETALSNHQNLSEDDIAYILKVVEAYGKGRYAQRLAPKLKETKIPEYIKEAIQYIVKLLES